MIVLLYIGCASKGRLSETDPAHFYKVPKLVPESFSKNGSFVFYGDNRPGWRLKERFYNGNNWKGWRIALAPWWLVQGFIGAINWYRHVPDFGHPERNAVRQALEAYYEENKPDFIMNTGDLVTSGVYADHWKLFLDEHRKMLTTMPFLPVVGNHEMANDSTYGWPNMDDIFPYPSFHQVSFPDADVFIVDSDLILDQYLLIPDDRQAELFREWFVNNEDGPAGWLQERLENSDKRFKIVAMHHPLLSFGKHRKDWFQDHWGSNIRDQLKQLVHLLQRTGVQLILAGHEHNYERNLLSISDAAYPAALNIVISGGGGTPLRPLATETQIQSTAAKYSALGFESAQLSSIYAYHFCEVNISENQLQVRVIGVDTDAPLSRKVLESFVIK